MKDGFLFGAATSAHQIEGNNVHNDWWAWEQERPRVENSGRAADGWRLYKGDFALAKSLGHTVHRLSLEWSRIEPKRGAWNQSALKHYRDVLQELKRQELASFVTLHHFTNPYWFASGGGWGRGDAPDLFARYVRMVVQALGDLVDFWVTINEPMVYVSQSFWHRRWPPGRRNAWLVWEVVRHMAAAHRRAYRVIHGQFPTARVGIAKHLIAFAGTERLADWWFNRYFYSRTRGTHDFLGVNYYFSSNWDRWQGERSDLGWPIDPQGLGQVLDSLKAFGLPVYITENGLADANDTRRAQFIRDHLRVIEKAQANGVDVRGYMHWSLLDNFEWAEGFAPRFGLVAVDYATMGRTPRPSAYAYKAMIEQVD